ncbi:MAG: hypothetical protein MO846_08575, partial [Candidatus Devosia symbiotica]|nr:hypothetical protein [Candidatus Devosia symbiotica]
MLATGAPEANACAASDSTMVAKRGNAIDQNRERQKSDCGLVSKAQSASQNMSKRNDDGKSTEKPAGRKREAC